MGDLLHVEITHRRPFLTASWRYLAMLNYRIEPSLLLPFVPAGTVLDAFEGTTYVSLVAFLFEDTKLLGVPIPFHRNFEELNLRFYVRREVGGETRRAVVFLKELVPRPAIALIARLAYNEPYMAVRMQHRVRRSESGRLEVGYRWRFERRWHSLSVSTSGEPTPLVAGSEEEFIAEHYWGYTRQRNGDTLEYEVAHPRWRVWTNPTYALDADLAALYGPELGDVFSSSPASVLLAEGSPVIVHQGQRLSRQAAL